MKKLRLLLTDKCDRACAGCCNKSFDLQALPVCADLKGWDEIYITGGEPMLFPNEVIRISLGLYKEPACRTKLFIYTAKVDVIEEALEVLGWLDGMTLTLHEQADVAPFLIFNERVMSYCGVEDYSLRLNVFEGVTLPPDTDLSLWDVRTNRQLIKDCPVPEGEVFMRYGGEE